MGRIDKIEYEKRIRIVQEWILQDHLTSDIVAQCSNKLLVSTRQGMRYIADDHAALHRVTEKKAERRLNYHLLRRQKLLRDLEEKYPENTGRHRCPAGRVAGYCQAGTIVQNTG